VGRAWNKEQKQKQNKKGTALPENILSLSLGLSSVGRERIRLDESIF